MARHSLSRHMLVVLIACGSLHAVHCNATGKKAQINQQTDLFGQAVPNKATLQQDTENQLKQAQGNAQTPKLIYMPEVPTGQEQQDFCNQISSIDVHNLEAAAESSETAAEFKKQNLFVNYNAPGMQAHLHDLKAIENRSNVIMQNIMAEAAKAGINCVPKNDVKPISQQFWPTETAVQERDMSYDRHYCEHLRNTYDCRDTLALTCKDVFEQKGDGTLTSSTMQYKRNDGTTSVKYSFTGTTSGYKAVSSKTSGGFLNKLGEFIKTSDETTTYTASEASYSIGFNITTDLKTIARFELTGVSYGAFIMVKVNGVVAFVGPYGGTNLYTSGHSNTTVKDPRGESRWFGLFGTINKISSYPDVSIGNGSYVINAVPVSSDIPKLNLATWIRQGHNTIDIKLISLSPATTTFSMEFAERICRKWEEKWTENCTLNATNP